MEGELPTIYVGADHAGFGLKETIKSFLTDLGYRVIDKGAFEYKEADDYPDYIRLVAESVAGNPGSRGIVFGGSGQGEAMVANRVVGARATVYYGSATMLEGSPDGGDDVVWLSREHNDANILSVGARFVGEEDAKRAVHHWLEINFPGDPRHVRRIAKFN